MTLPEQFDENNLWQPRTRDIRAYTVSGGFQVDPDSTKSRGGDKVFASRAARILGVNTCEIPEIFSASNKKTLRVNPFAFTGYEGIDNEVNLVIDDLSDFCLQSLDWYPRGLVFNAEHTTAIQESSSGREGRIFIQNASSFLPVYALLGEKKFDTPQRILDLCAAPGGKTALIAAATRDNPNIHIIANDAKGHRVQRLKGVLNLLQVPSCSIELRQENGAYLAEKLGTDFDKVLVDAECSTDSGINFAAKEPLKGWSMNRIRRLLPTQRKLAIAAYDSLVPGGTMVYSTCTLSPEENEGIITALLNKRSDAIIQPVHFPDEQTVKPIRKWEGQHFTEEVSRGVLRIFPKEYMESFCLSVIHKPSCNDALNKKRLEELNLSELLGGTS